MTILHHPSEARLAAYASGSLWAGHAIVVAAHIEQCEACQTKLRAWESIGGALMESLPPATMREDALERTLARLDPPAPAARPILSPLTFESIVLPRAIAELDVGRKRSSTLSIWTADIVREKQTGARAFLLGVKAGKSIPDHKHRGVEMTCVLKGSFSDANGTYAVGDFVEIEGESDHSPAVSGSADCICVISADGPPRFHRLVQWMAQSIRGAR